MTTKLPEALAHGGVALALDLPSLAEARAFALRVARDVDMLKVGLELFVAAGASAVDLGREAELPVFLDLKLHDIPETVDRAVARACGFGAQLLTVHASGGPAMLRRAVERAAKEGSGLRIVAVTVLTSFDDGDLAAIGVPRGVAAQAVLVAKMAFAEGVRAFVCSPHEAAELRAALGPEATIITPGVRPSGSKDDQKRVMAAGEAVRRGADWVVVGRPIRDAADPTAAARALRQEVRNARAERA